MIDDAQLIALTACVSLGIAIQGGGTCLVTAIEEFSNGQFERCLALLETILWVTLLVGFTRFFGFHLVPAPQVGQSLSVLIGGIMLGLGASLNGACALGTLARIGSGQWHYFLTLIGIMLAMQGAASTGIMTHAGQSKSSIANVELLLAGSAALLVAIRWLTPRSWVDDRGCSGGKEFKLATVAMGLSFSIIFLTVGPWSYTGALFQLAHDGPIAHKYNLLLVSALIGGTIAGGWTASRRADHGQRPGFIRLGKCLLGGMLMGVGGSLVPGGNDQLVLLNAPMFEPFAWIALAAMTTTISVFVFLRRQFDR
ncbi:MAG: YeeE/YedE thiosulfate transporter family protein [Methylocystis sp.]